MQSEPGIKPANVPKRPSFSFTRVIGALLVVLFVPFLIFQVFRSSLVHSGPSKGSQILNKLRQIDAAMQEWAIEHHQTGDVVVAKEDVVPYLRLQLDNQGWVKGVDGELYILKTLSKGPEVLLTRDLGPRPKGTVFRIGTNGGLEIILPGDAATNGAPAHR